MISSSHYPVPSHSSPDIFSCREGARKREGETCWQELRRERLREYVLKRKETRRQQEKKNVPEKSRCDEERKKREMQRLKRLQTLEQFLRKKDGQQSHTILPRPML
jgi:hypothetical protein